MRKHRIMGSPVPFVHLDTSAYEKYYGGLEKTMAVRLYSKVVNAFINNIDAKLDSLKNFLVTDQNQNAMVMAHQIKGSLLSLGGTDLAQTFLQIEKGVNERPNSELLQLLEDNREPMRSLMEELKIWVARLQLG